MKLALLVLIFLIRPVHSAAISNMTKTVYSLAFVEISTVYSLACCATSVVCDSCESYQL